MRKLILILSILTLGVISISMTIQDDYIDPTGTYDLVSETRIVNEETYGYHGQIQVKKITQKKIIINFYVNRGAPSYNSGDFIDTLNYSKNKSIYKLDHDKTTSCIITFDFSRKGVTVKEQNENYGMCGFGNAVIADGYFDKSSSDLPIFRDPLTDELIENINFQETTTKNCSAVDFIKLENKGLQKSFFTQLDSIRKVQYPDNDQETEIFVDLTPRLLNQFLKDINKDYLIKNGDFEKEYNFNISPPDYTDHIDCKDKIKIKYYPNSCSFRMEIHNTFLVPDNWCTESMVVYGFTIRDGKITDFGRNVAG